MKLRTRLMLWTTLLYFFGAVVGAGLPVYVSVPAAVVLGWLFSRDVLDRIEGLEEAA